MNSKGDFLIYIIFTIIILIIGAILYFVYLNDNSNNSYQDSNFLGEFKSKLPPMKESQTKEAFENSYPFTAKIKLDMKIEIDDQNIIFYGSPNFLINDRQFIIKDPTLHGFSGIIENKGISGYIENIKTTED